MTVQTNEKGQALILITLAAVGLFGFAALAIDGSIAFSNKRHAQNAADAAALAGALAYARGGDIEAAALSRARDNGYETDGTATEVIVAIAASPVEDCPGKAPGKDITVTIESFVDTTFARVIGRDQLESGAMATSRACGYRLAPLFDGYPIVGLNPDQNAPVQGCGFTTGSSGSVEWEVLGGNIFSNGCAYSKSSGSVELHGNCATAVGTATGFSCHSSGQSQLAIRYPADVQAIMPPNPCGPGGIGISQDDHGSSSNFSNGVYCIDDLDALDKKDITLDNATLYVTDPEFNLKFAGGGGFYGTATQDGGYSGSDPYEGFFMVVEMNDEPCEDFSHGEQVIEWRGNSSGTFTGTVLAPSACLDVRGNGSPSGMHTQLIAYVVGSNGDADVYINYQQEENRQVHVNPSISLLE